MNSTKQARKSNIGVVTCPIYSQGERIFLDNLIRILQPISNEIFVITGNFPNRYSDRVHITEIETGKGEKKRGLFARTVGMLGMQVKLTLRLVRLSRNFPIVLFHVGEFRNILPLLCSKLLGKKTVIFHLGGNKVLESRIEARSSWRRIIFPRIWVALIWLSYCLIDRIACESENIISFGKLDRYKHKIDVSIGRYVDVEHFTVKVPLIERPNLVGYAGRLSPKKGIINFVKAMPLVLKECNDIRFCLIGDGVLKSEIEEQIEKCGVKDKVDFITWVEHSELPDYLNKMRLFVLPSYDEGIPGAIQEAMACGTVVVATAVGGIPDLIKDMETGFIIDHNTPEGIAKTITRALNHPNLDEVVRNAQALIEKEYTYEVVVKRYQTMLQTVSQQ